MSIYTPGLAASYSGRLHPGTQCSATCAAICIERRVAYNVCAVHAPGDQVGVKCPHIWVFGKIAYLLYRGTLDLP